MSQMVRIADRIAHAMISDNCKVIMWGDGLLDDVACGLIKGRLSNHSLDRMSAACNALERAPDLFEKMLIRAHDCKGNSRVVRGFKLIGVPRSLGN